MMNCSHKLSLGATGFNNLKAFVRSLYYPYQSLQLYVHELCKYPTNILNYID